MIRNVDHDLVALLQRRAAEQPRQSGFTFLLDGETSEQNLFFVELEQRARAIGALLQAHSAAGSRVLLLYPPGLDYITAFFGCLFGGHVAVPAYPPGPARLHRTLRRLETIVGDANADVVLTTSSQLGKVSKISTLAPALAKVRWLATDTLDAGTGDAWRRPGLRPESLALLQYTSGSTGTPKGVSLTHANLLANGRMIEHAFGVEKESVAVGWLPLYHDMGLIGYVLQTVYTGFSCVLMSPHQFVARPVRWLEAISRYGGTTAGGPNFAYDLCVQKTSHEDRERIDLRSWTVAFIGAEPVRPATLARFAKAFEPSGFRRNAFLPCYGLAEASLLVSGKPAGTEYRVARFEPRALEHGRAERVLKDTRATELVSSGCTVDGCTAIVVDPVERIALPAGKVGEIWVTGSHVGVGYWGDREKSRETFEARLAHADDPRRFLRTGDLGFQCDGEIYISGRLKDLIIIRGSNFYPEDIEIVVEESHAALRRGCSAAFSIDVDGEERLVVAVEISRKEIARGTSVVTEASQAIRRALAESFDLHTHAVVLLKAGSLPRTSSGKVQRHACRAGFLKQTLDVYLTETAQDKAIVAALTSHEIMATPASGRLARVCEFLCLEVARVVRVPSSKVDALTSVNAFGLDSLMAIELALSLERSLGVRLSPVPFLRGCSISTLATEILASLEGAATAQVVKTWDDRESFPLSASQEALWFTHQLAPESSAHSVSTALRLRGDLSARALELALQALVIKHPALHTTYELLDGRPVQRLRKGLGESFALEIHDASSLSDNDRASAIGELMNRPFDLARGPVFRAALFVVSPTEHVLALAAHHIATDLWSIVTLLDELSIAYQEARAGRAPAIGIDGDPSYRDFVDWQHAYLASEAERDWTYWKEQIAEVAPLDLPTDYSRPLTQTFRGGAVPITLGPTMVERVNDLARAEGVTPFVVLFSAYQVWLSRYSLQQTFLVGTPFSGRRGGYERTVGYFVNPLPMRADLRGEPTFSEVVRQVNEVVLGAMEHQSFPLITAVQRSPQARDTSRHSIFQCVFALEKAQLETQSALTRIVLGEAGTADLAGVEVSAFKVERPATHFDLTLSLSDGPVISGSFIFNADLFESATVERMAGSFETLLIDGLTNPQRSVSRLAVNSLDDRRVIKDLSEGKRSPLPEKFVHELVAEQARANPDRPSISDHTRSITYGELERQANQLANRLRASDIGAGAFVALVLPRGVEMTVAAFGVLKAGAAYVPIDPDYPAERIAYMLMDSGARAIVVDRCASPALPEVIGALILSPSDWADELEAPPPSHTNPSSPAYCIYTSGSTGRPKGVLVCHRELLNLVSWHRRQFEVSHKDRATLIASPSFDASVWETWPYLACGASLLVPDNPTKYEPVELIAWLKLEQITIAFLPTPLAELVLESLDAPSLRYLLTGGDQLKRRPPAGQKFRLVNCYGPTESTVVATFAYVLSGRNGSPPPIGGPIANTNVYVLDTNLGPVPLGARGELYIGGSNLAQGYLGRPGLSAESFCPDPFDTKPGARMYRTGDIVRWRRGELEYVGRVDDQVKIRGVRVELGEVEAALREQPGVRDAAVLVERHAVSGERLVAYVVLATDATESDIRHSLATRLPMFMVPTHFFTLDALPLSPNGKVDRQALPRLGALPAMSSYIAPCDDIEARLAEIWQDVLGVERVGVADDFFELGGHSLLATQLASRIRIALGIQLELRELFEAPTVAALAVKVRERSGVIIGGVDPEATPSPLLFVPDHAPQPALTHRTEEESRLSFAQERLWFLDRLEPGSAAYNISGALDLVGVIDVAFLERCLNEVLRRHESLRMTFCEVNGEVRARLLQSFDFSLPVLDLNGATDVDRAMRLHALLRDEASRGFDLTRGPLLRGCLVKMGLERQVLVFTMHHIVSDGWSLEVLLREVSALYTSYAQGLASPLHDLSIQYSDYAGWQREWLSGARLDGEIEYWTEALAGFPHVIELPTDRARPPLQTFRGATLVRTLDAKTKSLATALAHAQNATPFMTLLASFCALLSRYTGDRNVIVGTPIANRTRRETEDLIGLFVNTLALGIHVDGQKTFRELVDDVRARTLEAYSHQDLPFEKLVEALRVERDLSRTPLVQAMCAMQDTGTAAFELPGIEATLLPSESEVAKLDLTLTIVEAQDGYELQWEYATDLFNESTIDRMATHFEMLLEAALFDPDRSVDGLPLFGKTEVGAILCSLSDEDRMLRKGKTLLDLFDEQVERAPEGLAIVHESEMWSYATLNRRANGVAAALRESGIGVGSRVAIHMQRTPQVVSAMLGVLKAGAAFVPIDPDTVQERISAMVADCGATIVLSDRTADVVVTSVGHAPLSPQHAAYVIYTSGSTGTPKGVVVEHASVVNYVLAFGKALKLGAADRLLQFSSLGVDVCVEEIFGALSHGATLVLRTNEMLDSSHAFMRACEAQQISILVLPTGYFNELTFSMARDLQLPRSTRAIVIGGEQATRDAIDRWHRSAPGYVRLFNAYGPTESTISSTWAELTTLLDGEIPIGRPVANTVAYVVDGTDQLCPIGVPGELLIGGAGVARGYLDRPALTAASFVPNPFGEGRLYRTGDRVKCRPDGQLEFLGRLDRQVKVRGFRIELGEVEAALRRNPSVRAAVVLSSGSSPNVSLIAYVVGDCEVESLREDIRTRLPSYMVPSVFVVLDALPLTPGGKVDTRALPLPEVQSKEYVAPREPTEQALARIWMDVLNVERVGLHDNFFDLGGHSLLATRVASRVREDLDIELAVRTVFEAPTLGELAARLRSCAPAQGARIMARERDGSPLPASFAQERLWFLDQLEPGLLAYNMPLALRLEGVLDSEALARAIEQVTLRHEVLRTRFGLSSDGKPLQVIHDKPLGSLRCRDLSDEPDPLVLAREAATREAEMPFDLSSGPLMRASLLRLANDDHVLLFTMHHIVSDAWSVAVLVREVLALYGDFVLQKPASLAPLTIQYADFAVWQRERLIGDELARQIDFWKRHLEGAPPALKLLTDRPRPAFQTFHGASLSRSLGGGLSASVDKLSKKLGATPFMTLLAAFSVLLARYSNQKEVVIGTTMANRMRAELEPLIGFFVNTLALRVDLSGDRSFAELVLHVKEVTLNAQAHQDLPFEKLVDALKVVREMSRPPVFQVMFILQNAPEVDIQLPGVTVTDFDTVSQAAKFDLTLDVAMTNNGYVGRWEYNTALFDAATVERMAEGFDVLLRAIEHSTVPIGLLPIIPAAERRELLRWGSGLPRAYDFAESLAALFEQRAQLTPDAVALISGEVNVTYRDLELRSRALSQRLLEEGVGREGRVGVCLGRSLESVVAMLAIWRSGAAYVALDPGYPRSRLEYMVADAGLSIVLTRSLEWSRVEGQEWLGVKALFVDDFVEPRSQQGASHRPRGDSLAYIVYTSGSTGVPKGVMGLHGATVNRFRWMWEHFPFAGDEIVCLKTSISFVDSVWETFGGLLMGVPSVVIDESTGRDVHRLIEALAKNQVTRIVLVPSLLKAMLEVDKHLGQRLSSLRMCVTSGEALSGDLANAFSKALPEARLINLYGQSEAAADVTWHEVSASRDERVPIGQPIANMKAYVLDEHLELCPYGAAGELYVAGVGLARGYFRRASSTAERFVPDPFATTPGTRMYRTGDVARRLWSGDLEYLGRVDDQLKVRGVRVELEEIAAVVRSVAGVRDVAIVARDYSSGDTRILAYVVLDERVTTTALRAELRARLPIHMIPSAFVALAALPLTPNGKLDRQALPPPDAATLTTEYVAPRNEVEESLARVWKGVLDVERVGIHDNFFELGGHSLLATQVVSRVKNELGVALDLRTIFESPTIAELAPSVGSSDRAGLSVRARLRGVEPLPLSFAQERLWFLEQLDPGNAAYNLPLALRLKGALDVVAFRRAFDALMRRHETLRTTFELDSNDTPFQQIHSEPLTSLELITDLRDAPSPFPAACAAAEHEARLPFDLTRGPLLRARLFELEDEHLLLLTMHHAISDRWSMDVLVRELTALYHAFVSGSEPVLPPLRIQYADYAVWQREWLSGAELERQLDYWKTHLRGAPVTLELPTDHPRPDEETFAGASISCPLGTDLSARVDAYCDRLGVTPFMTLFAAFSVLLGRYSNQKEVVIGVPIANRTVAEVEPLIGFFVNTLALRIDLSGEPSFEEMVLRVKEIALGAYVHQDLPFERLVDALNVPRNMSRSPVFQVMFALQNAPEITPRLVDLTVSPLAVASTVAQFELSLEIVPSADGYAVNWEFNTDLFERETIERMAAHFRTLLVEGSAVPSTSVFDLRLLDAREERRLLTEWNDTAEPFPNDRCIHELFREQAMRTPEGLALVDETAQLTYRELDLLSDRLAAGLQAMGVHDGARVALLLPRSLGLITAMLGTMKAGAAYLPIDASYPRHRIQYLLEDSAAQAVLSERDVERLVESEIVDLPASHPRQAAYVIYTSGSTGEPKGVVVEHRSAVNYLTAFGRQFNLTPADRFLQFASPSFDQSVEEIFAPLLHGTTLVLRSEAMISSPEAFTAACERFGITVLELPTAYWNELTLGLTDGAVLPPSIRLVAFGGEKATGTTLARWLRVAPANARLLNGYGPTEATVGTTNYGPTSRDQGEIPIGHPIANVQTYLLDDRMKPVPRGVVGELFIGGAGIARGYLGSPGLTALRFLPNPFGNGRLYRTGDAVRMRADGEIEFVGRLDDQIKVRGFRIELGEIENALHQLPGVRDAAVAAHETEPGDKRLCAYVVLEPGVLPAQLDEALRARLPEFMVPSRFVTLDALPLSPNGKVNRKALHPPEFKASAEYVAPGTDTEFALATIWRDVLRVERVGAHDNFFELGGHSLLATRVASRIRKELGLEMELRLLFTAPTVRELATKLESISRATGPPLARLPRDGSPLPLSFAQERMWFLEHLEPDTATYNMPFTLRLKGALDVTILGRVLEEIVFRHESLRTTFDVGADGVPVQVIHENLFERIELTDLIEHDQPEAFAYAEAEEEARTPFDLRRGPLLRTRLLRIGDEDYLFLVTIHHIVSDGWSTDVLLREVKTLYEAFLQGRPSPLRPLAIQYADFASWQRRLLSDEEMQRQISFWKKTLAGAPPAHEIVTDRPRPPVWTFKGDSLTRSLGVSLSSRIDTFGKRAGATPFMTMMAVFGALVGRYSQQSEVVIGTPFSNRTRAELEEIIGFFVNVLPLRIDLSDNPSFEQLVARVKEVSLVAYDHQDLPFDKLVEALNMPRDKSRSPVFQLAMTLEMPEATAADMNLAGVEVSTLEIDTGAAKFDLVLIVAPTPAGYEASWQFNTALFDRSTVERIADHYEHLLEAGLDTPETSMTLLPILPEAEKSQIVRWSRVESLNSAPSSSDSVHERFLRQAERTPEATAVTFRGRSLMYRELADRAGRLATHLQELGVCPGDVVAMRVERNADMIVCVLGILMAGAAYLPLDRQYPAERVRFMVEETGAKLVLVTGMLGDVFDGASIRVMNLEIVWQAIERCAPSVTAVAPHSLAYIIYTSGSTGRPKGVQISHANVGRLFDSTNQWYAFSSSDVWTLFHSIAFDFSVWEMWGALFYGGRLVVVSDRTARSPDEFYRLLVKERVTVLNQTPSAFRQFSLVDAIEQEPLALRWVIFGGEALDIVTLAPWFDIHGDSAPTLVNMYGITETTVHVTCRALKSADVHGGSVIGRPLPDLSLHILDPAGNPAPIGVPGEIYVGGAGLARGYWSRPALTAERFAPNPFDETEGARLYKTGDRARFLADGDVEYLGRSDHQVKVRGFRIELGEIENVIRAQPGVRYCAVVVRADTPDDKRLVAYVVGEIGGSALREALARQLPEYMVPSAVVVLESLPLTSNGKLDLKALPSPEDCAPEETEYVAPRSLTEERLARIWSEVLKVERVSIHNNFFELGGHSLLAAQLAARISKELAVDLRLGVIFEAPTISQLAAYVDSASGKPIELQLDDEPSALPAGGSLLKLRSGEGTPLILVHAVGGGVSSYLKLAECVPDHRPIYAIQSVGLDGAEAPLTAIEEMAIRYLAELRTVRRSGPYQLGGWSMGGLIAFEMARRLEGEGERVGPLLLFDCPAPPSLFHEALPEWPLGAYLQELADSSGYSEVLTEDELIALARDPRRDELALNLARELGIVPRSLTNAQFAHRLAIYTANLSAVLAYRPEGPVQAGVLSFRGAQSSFPEGWAQWTLGKVMHMEVPGDHYTMLARVGVPLEQFLGSTAQ